MSPPNYNYKLTYFDARGAAEPARFLLAYVGVPFKDIRIPRDQWPALKPKTPFRQLPYLELDGRPFGQSVAFTRLLAKKYNLAGTTEEEQEHVDAIVDYVKDMQAAARKWMSEKDETLKAKLQAEYNATTAVEHLDVLEGHLKNYGKGKFFTPSGVTFADFAVAVFNFNRIKRNPNALDKHALLKEHLDRVNNLPGIKEWISKRPDTEN